MPIWDFASSREEKKDGKWNEYADVEPIRALLCFLDAFKENGARAANPPLLMNKLCLNFANEIADQIVQVLAHRRRQMHYVFHMLVN